MILNVFYKGKGAAFEYANCDGLLNYKPDILPITGGGGTMDVRKTYTVHVDRGFIAWSKIPGKTGGNSINPNGKLGQSLIKLAKDWINNPETTWRKGDYWHALFFSPKYPPFTL